MTAGEVVWVGAGSLGSNDGRVRLVWRDQVGALIPDIGVPDAAPGRTRGSGGGKKDDGKSGDTTGAGEHGAGAGADVDDDRPQAPIHDVLRAHLAARGASFWPDLVTAAQTADCDYSDQSVVAALWDLVWAGEVTNDSLTPLRALVAGVTPKKSSGRSGGRARRPNMRALSRLGPASGTGRWALVSELRGGAAAIVTPTEAATGRALQLLERYGVLTREMALAEGAEGGFAGVYPILKEMEDRGQVRRGYFVTGLGAAQFALPGAVDRLRDERQDKLPDELPPLMTLAAVDPAQSYGAAIPWPENTGRPSRSTGSYVVLRNGVPLVFCHRGGRSLTVFEGAAEDTGWVGELIALVVSKRMRSLEFQKVNGDPAAEHPEIVDALLSEGFKPGYRGPTYRK